MQDEQPPPPRPATSFKLPIFMPTQAEIWVAMAEDTFAIHNITDSHRSKPRI